MKRSIALGLGVIAVVIIYAYGFSVTQVDLEELGSETRQQALTRIIRALAHPDILVYDQDEMQVETEIYVPCPADGTIPPPPESDLEQPYMTIDPACANPGEEIAVEGFNFTPNAGGALNFIPPSGVSLQMAHIETDGDGRFAAAVKLRDRTSEDPQHLRAVVRRNVGIPRLSQNGEDTIAKIIETVFMALLATTLGTFLAIPVSFLAARNLMRMVTSPLTSVSASLIAAPFGVLLGAAVANWMSDLSQMLTTSVAMNVISAIAVPLVTIGTLRLALPGEGEVFPSTGARLVRLIVLALIVLGTILTLYLLADLAISLGVRLEAALAGFSFLGSFVADLGKILKLTIVPICAFIGAGIMVGLGGRVGQAATEKLSPWAATLTNLALGALAGSMLAVILMAGINWLYQFDDPLIVVYIPAALGAVAGLVLALRYPYQRSLPVGLAVYSVMRTVLNALRSVEALIMVIVFAVWVGIGPFAGVLALGLHTVAALAKLYSEQVESIGAGPLEAVLATGANRLQMIVYAVIPQIVPPYISFTMYRWDINVRMSTIIGFAGGGGIGFLLQQNINLLNYRAASAQILAIAIVVSLMDYISSSLRQRAI